LQQDPPDENPPSKQGSEGGNARVRNISRGVSSLSVQNILTSGLGFIFLAVLTRTIPYVDYTAYSAAYLSVTVATTFSTFGLQSAGARFIALFAGKEADEEKRARSSAKTIIVLALALSTAGSIVFVILSPSLSFYFMKSGDYALLFEISALFLFAYTSSSIFASIVSGLKKYTLLARMYTISRVVMLIFSFVALELTRSVFVAIFAWIIFYGMIGVWSLRVIRTDLLSPSSRTSYQEKASLVGARENHSLYSTVMKYSLPLAVAGMLAIISTNGDGIILGYYTSTLGAYNVVVQISTVLSLVLVIPLTTALLPEVSSSSGIDSEISNGARLSIRFFVLGLLPASLLMAALSSQLIDIFSGGQSAYLLGVGALEIISSTALFTGLALALFALLQAIGRTVQVLVSGAVVATADLALSLVLVPHLGIIGAATSKALVAIISTSLGIYFARKYLNNLDSSSFYVKSIVASSVPFVVILILSDLVSSRALTIVPYTLLGVLLFVLCLRVLRLITPEDKSFVSHFLPRKMQKLLSFF
jgi:O-antigen/teichoic acid export membrane protein